MIDADTAIFLLSLRRTLRLGLCLTADETGLEGVLL